jgi:hypothetical protein
MSVFSRGLMAGLLAASLLSAGGASAQQKTSEEGRFLHASKCLSTLGFGAGCDKDEPVSKEKEEKQAKKAEHEAAVTKVSTDTSTKAQFFHASKCVGTLGFGKGCDSKQPYGTTENPRKADVTDDHSTKGRFFQATKCVGTLGLASGCDDKK